MPALDSQEDIRRFVQRRIRRDWRDDIEVIGVTEGWKMLFFEKKTRVEIGCSSYIACEQARISLAAFVANDASDWKTECWRIVEDRDHPLRLELIEPKTEVYEEVE